MRHTGGRTPVSKSGTHAKDALTVLKRHLEGQLQNLLINVEWQFGITSCDCEGERAYENISISSLGCSSSLRHR
jgi:hypothetical protein